MIRAFLVVLVATILMGMSPAPSSDKCSAPIPVPPTVTAPHSTYYTDVEPPKRFAHVPKGKLHVTFGQAGVDKLCGKPPCGLSFEACTDGDEMALPDPFSMSNEAFARIVRHEIAHANGWPATHGD